MVAKPHRRNISGSARSSENDAPVLQANKKVGGWQRRGDAFAEDTADYVYYTAEVVQSTRKSNIPN